MLIASDRRVTNSLTLGRLSAVKSWLLAGVLVLPWTLGIVIWATQAEAGAQDRKAVSTWNVVGDDPGGGPPNQGDPPANTQPFGERKMDLVAFGTLASNPKITSFALQEVCRFQYNYLFGLLEPAGWRVRWTKAAPVNQSETRSANY
jgi:hypothetical protein